MTDSIILERVADAAADCFYGELLRTEDLGAFEQIVAADTRLMASMVLRKCLERFDSDLRDNMPPKWSVHESAQRTLVTLVGVVTFERTIFLDEFGRRRAWADELLGIPSRARLSACAFLWIASHAAELSYRKTAAEFIALTSASISHVTVMNVVHREGALLKESGGEFARDEASVALKAFAHSGELRPVRLEARRVEANPYFMFSDSHSLLSSCAVACRNDKQSFLSAHIISYRRAEDKSRFLIRILGF